MEQSFFKSTRFQQIKKASSDIVALMLIWLGLLWILSIYEIVLNGVTHEFPKNVIGVLAWSWLADFLFWFKWLWISLPIFTLITYFNNRLGTTLLKIGIVVMVLSQLVLMSYFNVSLVPLGEDFYGYSLQDIKQTIGASGGISIGLILGLVVLLALVIWLINFLPSKFKVSFTFIWLLPLLSLLFFVGNLAQLIGTSRFQSDFANNLTINKSAYFFSASYGHFFPVEDEIDIYADSYIGDFDGVESIQNTAFQYIDEQNYPFLHQDETPDVLSPFFNVSKTKPNVVIVLVEGLGRAFTNEGAYLGNFTPFIDSLSQQSLYWKNFLSEGGRTFAVLPSVMGSLPFGKNGFLELGNQMPAHVSLYNIFKQNGYRTSFYYGGDSGFDQMKVFLNKNKVDAINDIASFPSQYQKMPAQNGFTWGYPDDQLFAHFLQTTSPQPPSLNVILTVSTHNPFLIANQARYIDLFEKRMSTLGFDAQKKSVYRNYKLQYSSILFLDEALKKFFDAYKKRADYANTIFIVTGDHRMPEIPMATKIDRYHVPLLVFSPLLKRTASMESVSTHFDIAPSLLAFMKKNYGLKTPSAVAWMGDGLDTARNFRNIHRYPIIQTKAEMVDFIMGEYHLNQNVLYKLDRTMQETQVTDEQMFKQVKNAFDLFKKKNVKVVAGAKLYPDSVLNAYKP